MVIIKKMLTRGRILIIISLTVHYANKIVLFLAKNKGKVFARKVIAASTHVPEYYAVKVITKLVKCGIVKSSRGHEGGFSIPKNVDLNKITLIKIKKAVETRKSVECWLEPTCCAKITGKRCKLKNVYLQIDDLVNKEIGSIAIASLLVEDENTICCYL